MNTSEPESSELVRRRRLIVAVGVAAAVLLLLLVVLLSAVGAPKQAVTMSATASPMLVSVERPQPSRTPGPVPISGFNRAALSIDDPESLWVVVNKQRPLSPRDFVPDDLVIVPVDHTWEPRLRPEASKAVEDMFDAADDEEDLDLESNSAYRDYDSQVDVYQADVVKEGVAYADTYTARPGFSEHQTGLAIDIGADSGRCAFEACFADTPEGQWLAANAWRFGFILRYPADKAGVTGFAFEPWHFRYVGVPLATEMRDRHVSTLEEFFLLPPAPRY